MLRIALKFEKNTYLFFIIEINKRFFNNKSYIHILIIWKSKESPLDIGTYVGMDWNSEFGFKIMVQEQGTK